MERLDDFDIVRELGRGGMGVVHEAIEQPLGRRVALKVLHPEHVGTAASAARFVAEARAAAGLSHPNIVRVHRFVQRSTCCYLALEFIDGPSLDAVMAKASLPIERALYVLASVAAALGHAHRAGVVHRDVKPGNVLAANDGRVVLGDFGIAKQLDAGLDLTRAGDVIGTPAYMSPEQALGEAVSPATDVYSLGVMAFELLAGRVPFTADTALTLLLKHVREPAPPLVRDGLPPGVASLVSRMLAKDPSERPRDGEVVAQELQAIALAWTETCAARAHASTIEASAGTASTLTVDALPTRTGTSCLAEVDLTAVCFELRGFSRTASQDLLPARAAFVLESWLRLVRRAVAEHGGTVDRNVADKVTALFGFPDVAPAHTERALRAAHALSEALSAFNHAHDLSLRMRAGVACGPTLVGHVLGDSSPTTATGTVLAEMAHLSKLSVVEAPIRLTRTAFRRVSSLADFARIEDPKLGELWATEGLRN